MSQATVRTVLAIALHVAAPVVFVVLFIVFEETMQNRDADDFLAAGITTAVLFVVAWIALWRSCVLWTKARRMLTALSIFWCVGVVVALGTLLEWIYGNSYQLNEGTVVVSCMMWLPMWVVSTTMIWRESAAERIARLHGPQGITVRCPKCGYDMTGLHEARCPECGTQYTLDQLLALTNEDKRQIDDR
ncbi:MAG: hypothetical protein H6817_02495 [Phycisphaerales bacterium]|nr:hypothetical protein [Phycisphaerales bacterium]